MPNPFTPNQPIDPDYFAGRLDEVKKVSVALNQTRHAKTQHLLLTGERGIGKTSLALYANYLAVRPNEILKTDFNFATAYYSVERGQTVAEVCRGLTSALLDRVDLGLARQCIDKLKKMNLHFSIHVPAVGDIDVGPGSQEQNLAYLHADFVKAVEQTWSEVEAAHNGILLIVDELHNLASFDSVGSFFKIVSESWTVHGFRKIMFMVIGLPEISSKISEDDPSAPRIFTYVELKRMTEGECEAILKRCLADTGKDIAHEAAQQIALRSGGIPYFLHQLGYDAFEVDTDNLIDARDVESGLIKSLVQFERMFFGKMYRSVEGKQKQKIVDELAERGPQNASQLQSRLKIPNVHQYLKPLENDGIVERVDGTYRLSSDLLAIYVQLFKTAPRRLKQRLDKELSTRSETSARPNKC